MTSIPFVPTIYEHAAALIGKTPSQIACSEDLLVDGQMEAYRLYEHDAITVGVDVYNIEAEALGAEVTFCEDDMLPTCHGALIRDESDLSRLRVPDPETDGRMPLLLNACTRIRKETPVPVSGTMTGPFTLAAILRGYEQFTMDLLTDPDFALRQLRFTGQVGLAFARAYRSRNVGIVINESWIAPPLCSPALYRQFALPAEREMIAGIKGMGTDNIALISGGNTTPIVRDMVSAGPSLIMADWGCDLPLFVDLCRENDVALRACVEARMVREGTRGELQDRIDTLLDACLGYEKTVMGCGIVAFDTPPERVIDFREMVRESVERRTASRK